MGFLKFVAIVIFLMWLYLYLTRNYVNPYKLIMIFGKKGCGKTTYMTKLSYQHNKDGWTVFCTEDIPYSHRFDVDFIGKYWFPERSCILIDEVGMIWDNRDFKSFQKSVRDWFKFQRHNKCKVYLFSQSFDIDKKLRDLTDAMYLLKNVGRVFSYGKKIRKSIVLNNSTAEAPSNIAENLEFEPFIFFWLGTRTLTFIPRWSKDFDSHVRLDIPNLDMNMVGPVRASVYLEPKAAFKRSILFIGDKIVEIVRTDIWGKLQGLKGMITGIFKK